MDSALYQLRQKSGQMFNDYGLWVLWLGIGMLDWREDGAHEGSLAPLLLVPVELRRDTRRGYRLHLADNQDRAHNPALAVKLERMGVDWSTVTATDVNDLPALFSAARAVWPGVRVLRVPIQVKPSRTAAMVARRRSAGVVVGAVTSAVRASVWSSSVVIGPPKKGVIRAVCGWTFKWPARLRHVTGLPPRHRRLPRALGGGGGDGGGEIGDDAQKGVAFGCV